MLKIGTITWQECGKCIWLKNGECTVGYPITIHHDNGDVICDEGYPVEEKPVKSEVYQ